MNVCKLVILLFFAIAFSNCNSATNVKETKESIDSFAIMLNYVDSGGTTTNCKPYYNLFDKVEHYYFDISSDDLWALETKKKKTAKEEKQLLLLLQDKPEKLSEVSVLKNIESLGFVKKEIASNKLELLNNIFCEREHKFPIYTPCIAEYRDILIFYNKSEIIGTAKICFSCNQHIITGTKMNDEEFGQSGDYARLYKILHEK